jgi:chemotaxis protein CheD
MDTADPRNLFLHPGDVCFGDAGTRMRTILGSCVSFTAWHPARRIGAMTHFLLPTRRGNLGGPLDGRYCDDAVLWFLEQAEARRTRLGDYEIKVFGGGDMFSRGAAPGPTGIGQLNVEQVLRRMRELGQPVVARHVGGAGHRSIVFDIATGNVWVKHAPEAQAGGFLEAA